MTTIRNFMETYIGRAVDEDGIFRGQYPCFPNSATKGCHQCVSLIKFFCKTVYGTRNNAFGDAANGANASCKFLAEYHIIPKTSIAKRGDIVVFQRDSSNWNYGHIGIVLYANNREIYYIDQNAGNGDGYGGGNNAITIRKRTYDKVIAFRRHPNINNTVYEDEFDALLFNGAPYIWEATNYIKRSDVADGIRRYFGRVDWSGSRPYDAITRFELATMIARVSGKDISSIYNGNRPNDAVSGVEYTIMMHRGLN